MIVRVLLITLAFIFSLSSHAEKKKPFPDESIYQLQQKWTDQNGSPQALSNFAGKNVVLALIFTRCQYSCPITISHLQGLEEKLTKAERENTKFVLVSLDPTFDSPKVLKAFAKKRGLGPNWVLLNGHPDDVRTLSVVLGMRYKATGKGEFSHGRAISILDEYGVVAYQGQEHAGERKVLRVGH